MRRSSIASALVVLTAGLTATALRRASARRRAAASARAAVRARVAVPTPAPAAVPETPDAVVLPFTRPVAPAPAAPARCGDSGGLTRAGAPCGGRATSGGRCHHHPIAA